MTTSFDSEFRGARRFAVHAATGLVLIAALSACGGQASTTETSTAENTEAACTQVDAPLVEIPTPYAAEPLLRIPQPAGWERSTEFDGGGIRFTLMDSDSPEPQNIATVTVGRLDESADADSEALLDELRDDMIEGLQAQGFPTDYETTATTVCGLPARKHSRTATPTSLGASASPRRTVTGLSVISKQDDDVYWIQLIVGAHPDSPADTREGETILSGFQVLPPPA